MTQEELKDKIRDFIDCTTDEDEGTDTYALYGFYVAKFHKMCNLFELPEKLAEELMTAPKEVKQEFLDTFDKYWHLNFRVCSVCGKFINEGWDIAFDTTVCGDKCAVDYYTQDGLGKESAEGLWAEIKAKVEEYGEDEENEVYWRDQF